MAKVTHRLSEYKRKRLRRRRVFGTAAGCVVALWFMTTLGVDIGPLVVVPVGAFLLGVIWLGREAYLDARTRGHGRARAMAAAVYGLTWGLFTGGDAI